MTAPARAAENPMTPEAITAEKYLRSITTLQARFVQTANDGQELTGTFYLNRPGRLRFEYDPPVKDFIVADGLFVYYYDSKMKQQSSMPVSQSLADFFLRKDLRLSGDITVSDIKRAGGMLHMTLSQTSDPEAGALVLGFSETPFRLKKWRVVDAQGLITEIDLFETQTGIALDKDLFRYYDPDRKKEQFN